MATKKTEAPAPKVKQLSTAPFNVIKFKGNVEIPAGKSFVTGDHEHEILEQFTTSFEAYVFSRGYAERTGDSESVIAVVDDHGVLVDVVPKERVEAGSGK